jgi:hypothetical protein
MSAFRASNKKVDQVFAQLRQGMTTAQFTALLAGAGGKIISEEGASEVLIRHPKGSLESIVRLNPATRTVSIGRQEKLVRKFFDLPADYKPSESDVKARKEAAASEQHDPAVVARLHEALRRKVGPGNMLPPPILDLVDEFEGVFTANYVSQQARRIGISYPPARLLQGEGRAPGDSIQKRTNAKAGGARDHIPIPHRIQLLRLF